MNLTAEGVRKQNMVVLDERKVDLLLRRVSVGYLGLADNGMPYVVPLNFVWYEQSIYFHGAAFGRKAELMANGCPATFVVAEEHGIMAHPVPAKTDTAYMSAMVFGQAAPVPNVTEATAALQAMLDKYVPGYFKQPLHSGHVESYVSGAGSHVVVYKLTADKITAKEDVLNEDALYFPGRTIFDDVARAQK